MSNQSSNLCNYRSFSFCTPFLTPLKPYATARRPFFSFQHKLVSIGRRSRRKSSSFPLTPAAQLSSDLVLIATTEHSDGSLVFRFGDASEVVKNVDAEEETENQIEQESSVVKILDGDQDIEVVDGIKNADIDSDIAESETNGIRVLKDSYAESSEILSDISEKEVLLSEFDAKMNDSLIVAESTLDETTFSVQLDKEESSDPTIHLLDDSPNIDKSEDPEGILLEGNDDKTVDPYVSVELESAQVSQIGVIDDLEKVETEDTRKSDTEDIVTSALPVTMHISDIEGVNTDEKEELQDMNINEATIIDEMPSSDQLVVEQPTSDELEQVSTNDREGNNEVMDIKQPYAEDESEMVESKDTSELDTEAMHVSDVDTNERLQDMNVSEGSFIDEMPTSDSGFESSLELSTTKDTGAKDAVADEKLEEMNISEGIFADEMSLSDLLGADLTLEVSTAKDMVVKDVDTDERLQDLKITEGTLIDEMPTSDLLGSEPTLEVSTTEDTDVKDVNVCEGTFIDEMPTSDTLGSGPTLEVSTTEGVDIKDIGLDERLQDMKFSEGTSINGMPTSDILGAEPSLEVSINEYMDAVSDKRLQDMNISEETLIDERPTSDPLSAESSSEVSTTKDMDVKDVDMDERLQYMKVSEGTFIDEKPRSDPLGAEPTLEASTTKDMVAKDVDTDERLQDINISEGTFTDEMPTSDLLGAEPTLEVSATKDMDVKDVDMDEILQNMNISEDTLIDEKPTFDLLGAEPTLEASTTKDMVAKDVDTDERLQYLNTSGGTIINEMPTSGSLRVEPALEVSDTEALDDNSNANLMPSEPIVGEEVSQPHLTPVELKATMDVSDIKVLDASDQNLDAGGSYIEDVKESSHPLESQPVQDEGLKQSAHDPLLEAETTEDMVGSNELAEASEVESRKIYVTDDFLSSGAAMLEHPFKALTGGDDAYFVAGSKWLGVANGVSQWSFEGTGPGTYAQKLMKTCEEIVLDTSRGPLTNPVDLLCRGIKETNMSGSSTVLIANFNGQALHVANIGDTGYMIIRHGAVYKKSSPLLHEFHFALHVDDSDDPLLIVEEHLIELEAGDVVISATDGLFDNLYDREITMIVSKSLQAGMKPQEIANMLATRAQEVGKSAFARSPFSDAAQAAGYTGYAGGKPDNVAVIVSLVENTSNLLSL